MEYSAIYLIVQDFQKSMANKVLLTILILSFCCLCSLEIDKSINKALETFEIPGAAVGIVIDGEVALTKGYGLRNGHLPVTERTLFPIASCTKAFTAYVLDQLVNEGKVNWDDRVIDILPEFRLKDEYAAFHVTIRDLLTHKTGVPGHDFVWYDSDLSHKELFYRLRHLEPSSDLRGKWLYNNLMYLVAGLVIEKVTEMSWEDAVRSRILIPLGMNGTNFSVKESQRSDNFSLPYREIKGVIQSISFIDVSNTGPAISINSNINDMVKWVKFQLSGDLSAMHIPQVALGEFWQPPFDFFGYGLGWFTGIYEGQYYVAHPGNIAGFNAMVALLPKKKIGIVILINRNNSFSFIWALTDVILRYILTGEEVVLQKEEENKSIKILVSEMMRSRDDYVGSFENPGYGTINIDHEGKDLILSYHHFSIELQHTEYDHFIAQIEDKFQNTLHCFFTTNWKGEISEFHISFEAELPPIIFKRIDNYN
jgi:CubicO group peptidase (beta-lactamase class C family)